MHFQEKCWVVTKNNFLFLPYMSSSLTHQAEEPVRIHSADDALDTHRHCHFSQQAAEPSLKISAAAF